MRAAWAPCRRALDRLLSAPAFVPGCLAAAALLRLLWAAVVRVAPESDFFWYFERGLVLAARGEYNWFGAPTAYFPPGYPLLLAGLFKLAGPSLPAAILASVALQCGAVYLVYRLGRRLFASEYTGRLAMLLYACYPENVGFTSLLASEHLFIFLMLLGTALLLRARRHWGLLALCGVVWGLATLTRPQAVGIPALYFALAAWRAGSLRRLLLPCAVVHLLLALTLLPWFARNARVFGRLMVTSTTGVNLYIGNNPDANGTYVFTRRMFDAVPEPRGTELQFDDACRKTGQAFVREHPWRALALLPLKFGWLYAGDFISLYWNIRGVESASPRLAAALRLLRVPFQLYYLLLLAAFLAAVVPRRRRQAIAARAGAFPALGPGIVLYFTAVYLVYYGAARYHAPMMPWIIIYAAALAPLPAPGSATLIKESQFSSIANR